MHWHTFREFEVEGVDILFRHWVKCPVNSPNLLYISGVDFISKRGVSIRYKNTLKKGVNRNPVRVFKHFNTF